MARVTGSRYSFRANRDRGRHGWLRLTPAYSVHAVEEALDRGGEPGQVLDPFCGTGTTALVCAERGIPCTTLDINPFLVWLTTAKTGRYEAGDVEGAIRFAERWRPDVGDHWVPPIANVERWWDRARLAELAALRAAIGAADVSERSRVLLLVAFCRVAMAQSRAGHGHQSLSFQSDISHEPATNDFASTISSFTDAVGTTAATALSTSIEAAPEIRLGDARMVSTVLPPGCCFQTVITSPPYPNRMSYVRELRPYMYWLGFLGSGAAAGELDWRAIGGTWGSATSKLARWRPEEQLDGELAFVAGVVERIAGRSPILGRYVERYVHDMRAHVGSLRPLLAPGARLTYIVGNSRFYDEMVETERILGALFAEAGLTVNAIRPIRKRTSKRELFEFAVEAQAPGAPSPVAHALGPA